MSRVDVNQGLMPSILDRLIDPESGGTAWRRGYGIEQMMEAVRRDVEDLLNTRQVPFGVEEGYDETADSVITFGLPDFTTMGGSTREEQSKIGTLVEEVIERFEPRLKDVRVHLLEGANDQKKFTVRFEIHAKFHVEPSPEVAFETTLELTTGHAAIRSRESAPS